MERKYFIVGGVVIAAAVVALFATGIIANPLYDAVAPIAGLHDPTLERYVATLHDVAQEQHPQNITAWNVSWMSPTAVRVEWAYTYPQPGNASANSTYQENFVMTHYGNVRDATAAVTKMNSSYKLVNSTYGMGGAFERMRGHPPVIFRAYQDKAAEGRFVWQFDEFVQVGQLSRVD